MRWGSAVVALLAIALATLASPGAPALAGDRPKTKGKPKPALGPAPIASQVVVRRKSTISEAVQAAYSRAKELTPKSGVAVVLDPTEAVNAAAPRIAAALAELSGSPERPTVWQAGALGHRLSTPVADPAALGPALEAALAKKAKPSLDTLGMLRDTVRKAAGAGGLILYFAHARFEDAVDLEGFVEELKKAKRTLCVIGPEAAFERAWRDVLTTASERLANPKLGDAAPGVGTNPFAPDDPQSPWKGGDSAYPAAPYLFTVTTGWRTEFRRPIAPPRKDPWELDRTIAVPSGFGPYGLMRACGLTGGGYVLWGWTASDSPPLRYDYGRCDLFAPDLRARSEILDDLPRRGLAVALQVCWSSLAAGDVVDHTAPWESGEPRPMATTRGLDFWLLGVFETKADRDDAVVRAKASADLLDRATAALDAAIERSGAPQDEVDRRLRADVDLLLHALLTIRFRTEEFIRWSSSLEPKAWKVPRTRKPYVEDEIWISAEKEHGTDEQHRVTVKDTARAQSLLEARKSFLERYRGTPWAAIVSKNDVCTWKIDAIDLTLDGPHPPPPSGRGASGESAPPPPGAGSSGSPGPTTGG